MFMRRKADFERDRKAGAKRATSRKSRRRSSMWGVEIHAQIDYAVTGLQERLAEFRFKIDLTGDHVEVIDGDRLY
jgi:hypothetical protein